MKFTLAIHAFRKGPSMFDKLRQFKPIKFERRIGVLTTQQMSLIERALAEVLGLKLT